MLFGLTFPLCQSSFVPEILSCIQWQFYKPSVGQSAAHIIYKDFVVFSPSYFSLHYLSPSETNGPLKPHLKLRAWSESARTPTSGKTGQHGKCFPLVINLDIVWK